MGRQLGWVIAPYGAQQVIRLVGNIILTRLLAPEVFGLMLLVNSLRTGAELLSDIGIGQSVVRSPNGDDQRFLDVAWTLQLLRGILLTIIMALAAVPVARIYGKPELATLVLALSPIFTLTGAQSSALFSVQRNIELNKRAAYDIFSSCANVGIAIVLALLIKSVWALVIALLLATTASTIATHFLENRRMPRLAWDRNFVGEIVSFGKWIFFSTAIYFAATSFDRLYFVASVPIALAGIYGVSRTYSDMLGMLAQRAGSFLVFPKVAAIRARKGEMTGRLRNVRRKMLALVALATGVGIACSDQFILLVYDPRYHVAAFMVPILLFSVWFGILSAFADAMLMGCGRPAPGAFANGAKFFVLLTGLPLSIMHGDFLIALLTLIAAELARWAMLQIPSQREGFSRVQDDLGLTALMIATAVSVKMLLGWVGAVPTIMQWWQLHVLLYR